MNLQDEISKIILELKYEQCTKCDDYLINNDKLHTWLEQKLRYISEKTRDKMLEVDTNYLNIGSMALQSGKLIARKKAVLNWQEWSK